MTGMAFDDVMQRMCSTTQAWDNPEEGSSLGPLGDELLVYVEKRGLRLHGKSSMSVPLATLKLLCFYCIFVCLFLNFKREGVKRNVIIQTGLYIFFIYR